MFSYNTLRLGTAFFVGESRTIEFPYDGIHIKDVAASCGCSDAKDDAQNKKVKVTYTAQDVPIHLKNEGKHTYTTTKKIAVRYWITDPNNIQELTLEFTATVMDKVR